MIKELWDYFSTPATKNARADGYLYHAIALSHRAKRCQKYWDSHLKHCHNQIEKRIQNHNGHVAILGSGLLLETPLSILEKYFQQITLIDVVHTKQVRQQLKENQKVQLIEIDLNESKNLPQFDYVISANLLSQLPLVICAKMLKENIKNENVSEKAYQLQKKHLQDIQSMAPHGLLFSDYQVNMLRQDGTIDEESLSVDPRLNIKWETRWKWDLAPAPEIEKKRSVQLLEGIFSW